MVDFFLTRLGLEPLTVPSGLKRMSWLAPRAAPLPALPVARGYVLVCPNASIALRDMPAAVHEALLTRLAARGWGPVVTQGAALAGAVDMPRCTTIRELCAFVAGARAVISTDTAMVHLADAFSIPCLVFMTTHRPAMRVRDYPLCRAVHLPVAGLAENTEFVGSAADIAAARAAWFPDGEGLAWLDQALDHFTPG
jgi:ADP-heptose:LPS heptosyltransferase